MNSFYDDDETSYLPSLFSSTSEKDAESVENKDGVKRKEQILPQTRTLRISRWISAIRFHLAFKYARF